jgi:hypothetical protein
MKKKVVNRNAVSTTINRTRRFAMKKSRSQIVMCFFILLVVASCASTKVASRQEYTGGDLPRPEHIWVYDFVATAADVPADSELSGQHSEHPTPQTDEQIATGRKLGAEIAAELVKQILAMGLPAVHASTLTRPQLNDLVIKGYLLSIDEGSATKRIAIGFGSGTSHLKTAVEGFQMTAQGLRKLGSGALESGGSKGPGTGATLGVAIATGNPVGLIVSSGAKVYGEASGKSKLEGRAEQTAKEIADQLRKKFLEQGWVYPTK